jgi:hypothetical protein
MCSPARHFGLTPLCGVKKAFNHRRRLVIQARQHGIKRAAREFRTTLVTVRKWLRRYQARPMFCNSSVRAAPLDAPG